MVKPVPAQGKVLRELPAFMEGVYALQDVGPELAYGHLAFDRKSDEHCVITYFHALHAEEKDAYLQHYQTLNKESSPQWQGNSLYAYKEDTLSEVVDFQKSGTMLESEKVTIAEINLQTNSMSIDFEDTVIFRVIVKQQEGRYFLNYLSEEHWSFFCFTEREEGIQLQATELVRFKRSDLPYLQGLTTVSVLQGSDFLAEPSDTELEVLLKDPLIFEKIMLVKVQDTSFPLWAYGLIGIGILLSLAAVINRVLRKKPSA